LNTDGGYALHEKPIFHGGTGTTLEIRLFSRLGLERELRAAGFHRFNFLDDDVPASGTFLKNHVEPPA
jgi:hypothetical protein